MMDDSRNSNRRGDAPLIQGDANAISGLNYSVDSHDASNFNNTTNSNNISNSNNTTTNNFFQQSDEQRLAEVKKEYLNLCKFKIKGGLISPQVRRELDEWGIKMSLQKEDMQFIEQSVKNTFSTKEMLSSVDQTTLNLVLKKVESNAPNIKDVLPKMEALAQKVEQDEVQYWYYLLLAVEDPGLCIKRYTERKYDNYWQSYWTYMAYLRNGVSNKAGLILTELQEWGEYSMDNLKLLQCAELLYTYYNRSDAEDDKEAASLLLNDCYAVHALLMDFRHSLEYLANHTKRNIALSNSPLCNFHLRMFGLKYSTMHPENTMNVQRLGAKTQLGKEHLKAFSTEESKQISDGAIEWIDNKIKEEDKQKKEKQEKEKVEKKKQEPKPNLIDKHKNKLLIILAVVILFFVGKNYIGNQSEDNKTATIETKQEEPIKEKETVKKEVTKVKSNQSSGTSGTTKKENNTTKKATTLKVDTPTESTSTVAKTIEEAPKPVVLTAEDCIRKGIAAQKSFKDGTALEYFKQALAKGSNEAYLQIAHLYYNGGNDIEKNYSIAFNYYMKAAQAGYSEAQYMVGRMYRNGQGTEKNLNSAKSWLRKASAKGHADAEKLLRSL